MAAPFLDSLSLKPWLSSEQIEQVIAGGENYGGARVLHYKWVKNLYDECVAANVRFCFIETGTNFYKDGKTYHMPDKRLQSRMAYKSGLQYAGNAINWRLYKPQTTLFADNSNWYEPHWSENCRECGSRLICNGCTECGLCRQ